MPQGRASIGGASVELFRVVVVLVVVPLLLLVVEFASCVASCPKSVDDEVPAAVRQMAGPTRWAAWPHAVRMRCMYMPFASTALVGKNWVWSFS